MKKTKHGDYEKLVTFDVWASYRVHVIFTDDIPRSYGSRNEWDSEKVKLADAYHLYSTEEGRSHVFYNFKATPGTIVHEAWHIVRRMLTFSGAELDNETVAYHLDYLVDEIHKFKSNVEAANETSSVAQR